MTSDEKFEQWWATQNVKMSTPILTTAWKEFARTAWNARLSDEDAEMCIAALAGEEQTLIAEAKEDRMRGKALRADDAEEQAQAYAAVRQRLEGK